ncbi:hypothetical protein HDU93_009462 [Gonapodya sp. JEL0774]|nr:hypothetical protein HDU93_009462 [Gonapodya sp. JEL0774]
MVIDGTQDNGERDYSYQNEQWYRLTEPKAKGGDGKGPLKLHSLNHFAFETTDVESFSQFYIDVLGFRPVYRTRLGFKGSWLCLPTGFLKYQEDASNEELKSPPPGAVLLHIFLRRLNSSIYLPQSPHNHANDKSFPSAFPNEPRKIARGHHVALRTTEMDKVIEKLEERGIKYFSASVAGSSVRQVFFFDPDGNGLEIGEFGERQPDLVTPQTLEKLLDDQKGLERL